MEKYIKNILIKKINEYFRLNLKRNYKFERINKGRNNNLYKFKYNKLNLVIKYYNKKKISTFQREKFFYKHLFEKNIKNVPKYFFSIKKKNLCF